MCQVAQILCWLFFFFVTKMSLLVEALSRIATTRTTATSTRTTLVTGRVKIQENTNELFKYAKYITGFYKKKYELKKKKIKCDGG